MTSPVEPRHEAFRRAKDIVALRRTWERDRRELLISERGGNVQRQVQPRRWHEWVAVSCGLALAATGLGLWMNGWGPGLSLIPLAVIACVVGVARGFGYRAYRAAHERFQKQEVSLLQELSEHCRKHEDDLVSTDSYAAIAGAHVDRCQVLLQRRFPKADSDHEVAIESWVVTASGDEFVVLHVTDDLAVDMWCSPSGKTFLAKRGAVEQLPRPGRGEAPTEHQLDADIVGIWGLRDDFVLAWGTRGSGAGLSNVVYRYDGAAWAEMDAPDAAEGGSRGIVMIRGSAPDDLVAAGCGGLLSRWNGQRWRDADIQHADDFAAIHVESKGEGYAVGGSSLFELSGESWSKMTVDHRGADAPSPSPRLDAVAKFDSRVWVGSTSSGVFAVDGGKLTSVKPGILAKRLDASRGNKALLFVSDEHAGSTVDGSTFRALPPLSPIDLLGAARP